MPIDDVTNGVMGLLGFLVLTALWLGPRRWYVTDYAREQMFAAREEFFDFAASGGIEFTNPNYIAVRQAINANIRFAHTVSLTRVLLFMRHSPAIKVSSARRAANSIENAEAKWAAHRALNKVENAALRLLFLRSTIMGTLVLLGVVLRDGRAARSEWLRKLKPYSDAIQAEAVGI
jgi:hypothetical protein